MRHKYATSAIVLARSPLAEESALLTLLTEDLGLVRARAQGLRKPGAKLTTSLQTLCEAEVILVRGKDAWRISGAVLKRNWFQEMTRAARTRAARVSGLVLRLVTGEAADSVLYKTFAGFLEVLATREQTEHDAAECLAALRILHALGLDAGGGMSDAFPVPVENHTLFAPQELAMITSNRTSIISRINRGITASGL